jgi:hypothetical protein
MQCNIGPNKKYLRWEWRFVVHGPRKLGFFFFVVVVTGRKKEFAGACMMEWNQIKSNQIKSISYLHKKPSSKEFYPTHGLSYCHLLAN